jgi:hypothetical protein
MDMRVGVDVDGLICAKKRNAAEQALMDANNADHLLSRACSRGPALSASSTKSDEMVSRRTQR